MIEKATAAILVISAAVVLSACAQLQLPKSQLEAPKVVEQAPTPELPPPEAPPPEPKALYQWYGDGRSVSHIEVNVDKQKAVFYAGPHEIGWATVASGVRSNPTPTGRFAVSEKVADKRSNLYGKIYNSRGKLVRRNAERGVHPIPAGGRFEGAKMPYFLRLTNDGIGMHAGPIPRPGRPASHGCIRLPSGMAPVLFKHVAVGTPVSIVGSGPSYTSYLASQQRKVRRGAPSARPEGGEVAATAGALRKPATAPAVQQATPSTAGTAEITAATAAPAAFEAATPVAAATSSTPPTPAGDESTVPSQPAEDASQKAAAATPPSQPATATAPAPEPTEPAAPAATSEVNAVVTEAAAGTEATQPPPASAEPATPTPAPAAAPASATPPAKPASAAPVASMAGTSGGAANDVVAPTPPPAPAPSQPQGEG